MRSSRRSPAVLNGLFILTLVMFAYLGAIGFGMVWLRHRISVTANVNRALEQEIVEKQREVNDIAAQIAHAVSPQELMQKNIAFGLNLVRPHEQQVVRVTADVERRLASKLFGNYYTANEERGATTVVP